MNRLEIVFLSIFLLLISFFGISSPNNSFEWLMTAHNGMDVMRVSLALMLIGFVVYSLVRRNSTLPRVVITASGLFMLGVLMGNIIFPGTYQNAGIHIFALDVIGFIEGSIVCLLYGLHGNELPISSVQTQTDSYKRHGKQIAKHA